MKLLEQHFDTAFSAPDGIPKLRELILKLAMQGKLVPQDPDDSPASELLKSIEAEKKRLVKEGKIKASKPQADISIEESPGVLPIGWVWVRNGYLFSLRKGKVPKDLSETKGSIPYLDIEALDRGNVRRYTSDTKAPQSTDKDILVVCDGSRSGLVLEGKNGAIGSTLSVIETPLFIQPFVKLIFRQGYQRLNSSMKGAAIPHLDSKNLLLEVIGLPPLAEQGRILQKVDQLMARCDELEKLRHAREEKRLAVHAAALSQLTDTTGNSSADDAWAFISKHFGDLCAVKENVTELRKAILQLAIRGRLTDPNDKDGSATETLAKVASERRRLKIQESPNPIRDLKPLGYEIPGNWEWRCLSDLLVSGPTNGFSPRAVDYETPVRSLTLSATTSGIFKGEHAKFIADEISPDSDLWLRDGDILVQRGNTLEYVGVPAIYRGEPNCYIYPDLMMKLRVSSELDTDFLYFAMSSEPGRNFLRERASGTSGTMPKINQKTLMSLPIPIPPIQEQHRIVTKVNRLMSLCNTLDEKIEAAVNQQTALLNALMVQM